MIERFFNFFDSRLGGSGTGSFEPFFWGAAVAAAIPCLAFPLYNPDLFWHLSAAKRMMELHAIPARDWLSITRQGVPWIDFEWASQLLYFAVYSLAGMTGLWFLKIFLLILSAMVLMAALRLYGIPDPYRAAGLAAWAGTVLPRSDIRPELFSMLGFGFLFLMLESRRLRDDATISGSARFSLPRLAALHPLWMALLFSVWAKFHAGFAYGLLLILLYAVGEVCETFPVFADNPERSRRTWNLWAYLICGFVGTLLQPFHFEAYRVLWAHWREMDSLAAHVLEWRPAQVDNPWHWPFWTLLFAGFGTAAAYFWRRRRISLALLAALIFYGISASQHVRHGAYFATIAVPLTLFWLWEERFLPDPHSQRARAMTLGVIVACGAYSVGWGRSFGLFRTLFHPRLVPLETAEFLALEKSSLGGRRIHHKWGWGGYLGWRLYPDFQVFQDGRYIFQDILDEEARATYSPETWQKFLDRYEIGIAIMENARWRLPTRRVYPGGSSSEILRPYYVLYMPRERWALVHWDDQALVFVRRPRKHLRPREYLPRTAVPEGCCRGRGQLSRELLPGRFDVSSRWLMFHEYRYARPFDDDALSDALRRREIPALAVRVEFRRHQEESNRLARGLPRW